MATQTQPNGEMESLERISGIPPRRGIGASKHELIALAIGVVVFLAIIAAFVFEST